MTDSDHAFYEFSDALLFPGYFGWNWNALSDCLHDLNWLPADGYLIVIDDAFLMLSDNAQDQQTLLQVLHRTVRSWSSRLGQPGGKTIPFNVVLMCDDDRQANQVRRLVAAAVHQTTYCVDDRYRTRGFPRNREHRLLCGKG